MSACHSGGPDSCRSYAALFLTLSSFRLCCSIMQHICRQLPRLAAGSRPRSGGDSYPGFAPAVPGRCLGITVLGGQNTGSTYSCT